MLHQYTHRSIHKNFLNEYTQLEGNDGYKLASNLRALAERDEGDVAGKEQSHWFVRDADVFSCISGLGLWRSVDTGYA